MGRYGSADAAGVEGFAAPMIRATYNEASSWMDKFRFLVGAKFRQNFVHFCFLLQSQIISSVAECEIYWLHVFVISLTLDVSDRL